MTRVISMMGSARCLRPGAVLLSLAALLIVTACSSAADRTALDDCPVFTEGATERDVASVAHSDDLVAEMELPATEVRWVGSHDDTDFDDTDFYAALVPSEVEETRHVVCFIVAAHELEVAGSSCSPDPYDSSDPSVQVRVGATGGAVEAFLIPAATNLEVVDGWHRASDYVVFLTNTAAQPEIEGRLVDDTEIVLRRITG